MRNNAFNTQLLREELYKVRSRTEDEIRQLNDGEFHSEREKCKRILFLFQLDLLPGKVSNFWFEISYVIFFVHLYRAEYKSNGKQGSKRKF